MFRSTGFLLMFFLFPLAASVFAQSTAPAHDIRVNFDLGRKLLFGVSSISLPGPGEAKVNVSGLNVKSVTVDGMPARITPEMKEIPVKAAASGSVIRIEYELSAATAPREYRSENPGVVSGDLITPEGISLTGHWHPTVEGMALYRLSAVLPEGLEGVSEADEIVMTKLPGGDRQFSFVFEHPVERISFVAGRYGIEKKSHNGIDIYTYFLPGNAGLSGTYIEYAERYLDMYSELLGEYPYKRFSIVENFLATGYAMPSFTLLGRDVIKLPFIVETSLGHEILHQWLGCSVYVDPSGGNWSEGLTTYLADHRYEDLKGKGPDYRKQMLVSYQSYVTDETDFPLKSFTSRSDRTSAAIGYNKAAMVFHMLKELVGDDAFRRAVRSFVRGNIFRAASWRDLISAFEAADNRKLDWFFKQWIDEKGGPEIQVSNVVTSYKGAKAYVSFDLKQKDRVFRLPLQVFVRTKEGGVRRTIEIDKAENHIEIETVETPVELVVDEGYDIFRRLSTEEFPPVISRLLGDGKRMVVLPETAPAGAARVSDFFSREGFKVSKDADLTYADISTHSIVVLGSETGLVRRLFGNTLAGPGTDGDDMSLIVKENPLNAKGVIAVLVWDGSYDIGQYSTRISHYGKYSEIAFRNGKSTKKSTAGKDRGIRRIISTEISAVEISRLVGLKDIIDGVGRKRIVYLGELHDRFEHHRMQFEIIRGLHQKYGKLVIGMEMFQRPYQKALDDFIAGNIGEKEFLKKSEYFSRWSFDYNLYREILMYARENRIPVIALNSRKELVSKVSKNGIYSLTREELKELPADMDMSDNEYRTRLRESFLRHQNNENRNFDFFHQAQVLWDEAMAHNINEYMGKNPESRMVVIAGGGHMIFGSGIPKRAHRLNGLDYSIILNSEEVEKGAADFVVFTKPVPYIESPRLMVRFTPEGNKLEITEFASDSVSEKAGLKKGDILVSIDGEKVEGIDDVKIHLFSKKKGDIIKVTVLRNRLLLGPAERSFDVTL